ncbi:MAG: aminotransferase class III-fold pyridoxal phosphate-dependent enzyme, partial [Phycisphaerales bacterium]|nr:aminotransferase class III-fold pyridoxal phosphate-dependent enzyme [Phycisphaerales bacterium]
KSELYFAAAKDVLVDGYSRPLVRDPYPCFIDRGEGCWIWDVDGVRRMDFTNNFTALVHGHCHPKIVAAVEDQVRRSMCSHFPSRLEAVLAEMLVRRIPSLEKVRFWNTGTEAVMLAVKMARAITGRTRIAKPEAGYHGQYDLVEQSAQPSPESAGPVVRPRTIPRTAGTPASLSENLVIFPNNDVENTKRILADAAEDLAAVIIDPLQVHLGYGNVDPSFLRMLREECTRHGVLLIFDEIVSLRDAYGGRQGAVGVMPDLTVMGKIIGGGLPVSAVGGPEHLLSVFRVTPGSPRVAHSGTFTANPLALAAGIESVRLLPKEEYARLRTLGDRLCSGVNSLLNSAGLPGYMVQYGTG